MDKKLKSNLILVSFGVILFAALTNLSKILDFFINIFNLTFPVTLGFMIAFVLNVPMCAIENFFTKLFFKNSEKTNKNGLRFVSLLLTVALLVVLISAVCTLIIPTIIDSTVSLYGMILRKWPQWQKILDDYNINTQSIATLLENFDLEKIMSHLTNGANTILSSAISIITSTVSSITTFSLSFIVSIYVLLCKDELCRQSTRILKAHTKDSISSNVIHVAKLTNDVFSKFLSGQCVEACILGILIFIAFTLASIPYASLIGVLTAVCAFIPYVGAFASCAIGVFLVAIAEPQKIIICIVVYLAVQFIENQFIYPHVVGTSVGLSPLWTLIAVMIGGSLLGLFGMIFFIPLTAVFFELLKENTISKEKKKQEERKTA